MEADLGDQLGEGGKKRKWSDDDDTPPPEGFLVRDGYKLGSRNGLSGKIKRAVAFSMVQDLVQQNLMKPIPFGNVFSKQQSNEVTPQASRSEPQTSCIDFLMSVNNVTVKPKPRPHPIKGKFYIELSIVT